MPRRRLIVIASAVVLAGCGGSGSATTGTATPTSPAAVTTTVATTATEAPTTTTTAEPATTVPPVLSTLTGLAVDDATLGRPAVIVKVDNHPEVASQAGLADADVLVEEEVEGISRFAAVFWSHLPAEVGPVRSARSTDVDALGFLGKPALAFSGANPKVLRELSKSPLVRFTEGEPPGAWRRERTRKAPHNLFVAPAAVAQAATGRAQPPATGFAFGTPSSQTPGSTVSVKLASTVSTWTWNGSAFTHERYGKPHVDTTGRPVTASSVVVAFVRYVRSAADPISPEAVTTGSGTVWVMTAGTFTEGRWVRPTATSPWQLLDATDAPIALAPGPVALVLARKGSATHG
ncbi:MAG TPA: DUF3048 domain-containing protein [Acidimicrobiales bacterium]